MDSEITINGRAPNLFRGLLAYRPRADRNSHENFLTESFAYLLAKHPSVATKIVKAVVGDRFDIRRITNIRTQVSVGGANGRGLPDMMIEVTERNREKVQVWIENKWDSSADPGQIQRYLAYLEAHDSGIRKHLALLTPRHTDARFCSVVSPGISLSHVTWSRIHAVLATDQEPGIAREFEQFLHEQNLVVRPITLAATLAGRSSLGDSDLRGNLWTLCSRVQKELTTSALTKDVTCHEGYGRVALWMFGRRISLGVLFDPTDHVTAFLDEGRPLDLIFRIEGPYRKATSEAARENLLPLVRVLERAGFDCDRHRRRANHHTLVLGHFRKGFPFDKSADEQVARLAEIFDSTQLLVANNRRLMRLLNVVKPY